MSRGRMGLCIALVAALVVGCARKTPEQKAQAKAQKAAVAQAKAEKKAAEKQAKADAKAAKKNAEAQAKAEKKRLAEEQDRAEAQAKAAKKQAETQAKIDKQNAEAQAKANREKAAEQARIDAQKADAQARLDRENAEAAAVAQRQQTRLAMADAKANEAATKQTAKDAKKAKKQKPGKPVVYPDDKVGVVGDPYFRPENNVRLIDRHFEAMAASGAADDATLYDKHFDGGELNALGRSKVALMLEAAPKNEALMIYIPSTGSDERGQARLAAVNKFWKDSQYASIQLQAKQGMNPNNTSPASIGLAGLRKMEKEEGSGGSSSGNGSSSGSSSSSGSTGTSSSSR